MSKAQDKLIPSTAHPSLYIFVHNVEHVYDELKSKGVNIKTSLNTGDYGMSNFDAIDPNGFIITFGKNSA